MKTIAKIILWIIFIWLGLGIFVVIFYAEEDWRGKHAWENCKANLEAQGEVLDWNKFIPPPMPEDQNFFAAPKMQEWFVKSPSGQMTNNFVVRLLNKKTTATITNEAEAFSYLKWSDQFEPDFDLIRDALKRPYARMDGGYSDPVMIPIPNYVAIRIFSQTLAQRAKCYLILHQPEKAFSELNLLNDSRRMLEASPEGQPMPLVATMLNVAVIGIYEDTIAIGNKAHAWQESQLVAIQKQLEQINLLRFMVASMREERVFLCFETEERIKTEETGLARGWFHQIMVTIANCNQQIINSVDLTNKFVSVAKIKKVESKQMSVSKYLRPYTFVPTTVLLYSKAFQTLAYHQTLINEAQIACALERYHLAHGEYPDTLDALAPQFIEKIPHDIVGGQPLHYRPKNDGKFLLYSIGWNETDDGGMPGTLLDVNHGDWVWQSPQK